jgi:hypothetical protein
MFEPGDLVQVDIPSSGYHGKLGIHLETTDGLNFFEGDKRRVERIFMEDGKFLLVHRRNLALVSKAEAPGSQGADVSDSHV